MTSRTSCGRGRVRPEEEGRGGERTSTRGREAFFHYASSIELCRVVQCHARNLGVTSRGSLRKKTPWIRKGKDARAKPRVVSSSSSPCSSVASRLSFAGSHRGKVRGGVGDAVGALDVGRDRFLREPSLTGIPATALQRQGGASALVESPTSRENSSARPEPVARRACNEVVEKGDDRRRTDPSRLIRWKCDRVD